MTEIQQNRYDQLIRRVNNIVAPGSMVGDALNELFPMIDVESLVMDLAFLAGSKHGLGTSVLTPSVGNLNHHQLFNPADSGNILTLTQVYLHSSATQQFEYVAATSALSILNGNVIKRDTREGVIAVPVGQIRTVQQAAGLPTIGAIFVVSDVQQLLENNNGLFVLAPGTGVTFASTIANIDSTLTFMWRERVAQAAELNF